MFSPSTNENYSGRMNEYHPDLTMAGIPGKGGVKGRSGPPGNMNAFKHGLAAIQKWPPSTRIASTRLRFRIMIS
jgi:hypothetical protein